MVSYCSTCGRQTPDDAVICPYCGNNISQNKISSSQTYPHQIQQSKEKDTTKLIIIIAVVFLVIILVTVAIAATVYVYISGMVGPIDDDNLPEIYFQKDSLSRTLTVKYVDSDLRWEELEIDGNCDISGLNGYIQEEDQITNCYGNITVKHTATETTLAVYEFD